MILKYMCECKNSCKESQEMGNIYMENICISKALIFSLLDVDLFSNTMHEDQK
jgi:hypothetical protein